MDMEILKRKEAMNMKGNLQMDYKMVKVLKR